jgi:hypothetical protein
MISDPETHNDETTRISLREVGGGSLCHDHPVEHRWRGMRWETWVENSRETAVSLEDVLPPVDVIAALDLIDHGGVPEGLLVLAESIVRERARVPASTITAILELGDGLLPEGASFPPDLTKFGR